MSDKYGGRSDPPMPYSDDGSTYLAVLRIRTAISPRLATNNVFKASIAMPHERVTPLQERERTIAGGWKGAPRS